MAGSGRFRKSSINALYEHDRLVALDGAGSDAYGESFAGRDYATSDAGLGNGGSSGKGGKSNFVAAVGNFSIQYNFAVLSVATAFMTATSGDAPAAYPEPSWATVSIKGCVFAGALAGMCLMGYLGDLIGRRRGMIATLSFVVAGALASALLPWGDSGTVYAVLCACRFILGFGVGGIYPMAAATAAEGAKEGEHHATRVAWAFFWQTPGAAFPYAVGWVLFAAFKDYTAAWVPSMDFRVLLGLGVVPALMVLWTSWRAAESSSGKEVTPSASSSSASGPSPWQLAQRRHWTTLIGTAGTWFLYDVAYYGTQIFTPEILSAIFGGGDAIDATCWQGLVVSAMGVPGALGGVLLIKGWGGRWLNVLGFGLMGLSFAAMAVVFMLAPGTSDMPEVKFALFCLLNFALNWGPNVATYVLPAQVFPKEIRTTFHGLSAAGGKLGAVVGTFMVPLIAPTDKVTKKPTNIGMLMWVQVALCLLGALVGYFCISPTAVEDAEAEAAASEEGKGGAGAAWRGGAGGKDLEAPDTALLYYDDGY